MAKKSAKKLSNNELFTAIALIVIGLLLCIFRTGMLNIALTVIGVVLIALGIYDIIRKNLIQGIIELVVGIVVIVCGWTILDLTLLILGIVFIAYGIYLIVKLASAFKSAKGFNKVLVILKPLLMVIFGILLVVARWTLGDIILIVIGVIAIIDGVLMLIGK